MKKLISILTAATMILALSACGSGGGTAGSESAGSEKSSRAAESTAETSVPASESEAPSTEAPTESEPAAEPSQESLKTVPGTAFPMPDTVLEIQSTSVETTGILDGTDHELEVTVFYATPEEAYDAFEEYYHRIQLEYHNEDVLGNRMIFPQSLEELDKAAADSLTFYIKYALAESPETSGAAGADADPAAYAGKYLCVEMTSGGSDMTEAIRSMWENRSYYVYLEITEEGEAFVYTVTEGEKALTLSESFWTLIADSGFPVEGDRIVWEDSGSRMVFERSEEIPDIEE